LAWTAIPLLLAGWLVVYDLIPSGRFSVDGITPPYLRGPVPEARVLALPVGNARARSYQMVGEPVYVDIRQSRPFTSLTVQFEFNPGSVRMVELGLQDAAGSSLTLSPLYHRALEDLSRQQDWTIRQGGGVTLFQRGATYGSVEAFLRQPPAAERVAVYRVPFALSVQPGALPADGPSRATDFIVTGYQPLSPAGVWRTGRVTFPLTAQQAYSRQLRLVFSVPERPLPSVMPQFRLTTVALAGDRLNGRVLRGWLSQWFR